MSRYVDLDSGDCVCGRNPSEYENWNVLRDIPREYLTPVVHGHWIDTGSGQECSVCGEVQYGYDSGRFYCQNCGAKMDAFANDINVSCKSDEVTES